MRKLLSTLLIFSTVFSTVACTAAFAKETVTTSAVQTNEVNTNDNINNIENTSAFAKEAVPTSTVKNTEINTTDNIDNAENTETNLQVKNTKKNNKPSTASRIANGLMWGGLTLFCMAGSIFIRANSNLVLIPLVYEVATLATAGMTSYSLVG